MMTCKQCGLEKGPALKRVGQSANRLGENVSVIKRQLLKLSNDIDKALVEIDRSGMRESGDRQANQAYSNLQRAKTMAARHQRDVSAMEGFVVGLRDLASYWGRKLR